MIISHLNIIILFNLFNYHPLGANPHTFQFMKLTRSTSNYLSMEVITITSRSLHKSQVSRTCASLMNFIYIIPLLCLVTLIFYFSPTTWNQETGTSYMHWFFRYPLLSGSSFSFILVLFISWICRVSFAIQVFTLEFGDIWEFYYMIWFLNSQQYHCSRLCFRIRMIRSWNVENLNFNGVDAEY